MQNSNISDYFMQNKDKSEHISKEDLDLFRTQREKMRSSLYITRQLQLTLQNAQEMLTRVVKRRGEIRQIAYDKSKVLSFDNKKVISIMAGIRLLSSVISINLDFKSEFITDAVIISVGDCLRHLNSLANIHLAFRSCSKITDVGLKSLSDSLCCLTLVTDLTLDFGYCPITDIGTISIGDCLRYLNSLTSLNISFESCRQISDKGLKSVSDSLRYLKSLTSIHLSVRFCDKISDAGLRSISDSLRYLNSLTAFKVNFTGCVKLTDSGLKSFSDSLKHLNSLTNINFSFGFCRLVSDAVLRSLSDGLIHLDSLTNISLEFRKFSPNWNKVKEEVKSELKKALKDLKIINID